MRKTNVKNEKGITLIVLIITIVVLILLSMVIMDFIVDGKIFNAANELKERENKQQNETDTLRNTWKNMLGLDNTTGGDTPGEDTTITIANCALKTKTINSITVEATATSTNEEDIITYELYAATAEDGEYTKQGESISEEQNTAVELTASGLENYTVYYWYVKASSTSAVESSKTRTRTKCPGNTATETTTTCTTCNGTGTATYTCKGGSSCSTCGGTGSITCTGTIQEEYSSLGSFVTTCCGSNYEYQYVCSSCGYVWGRKCASCGTKTGTTSSGGTCGRSKSCSKCTNGTRPCIHNQTSSHDYTDTCTTCNGTGSIAITVTGCSHGQTEEHDELPEDAA